MTEKPNSQRNQFTFYKSFDDVCNNLSDAQLAIYIRAILDVQFLRIKVEDVGFKDPLLSMAWLSQKHSITTSIKGYLDSQSSERVKNPYLGVYSDPLRTPSEGGDNAPCLGVPQQEQDKGQVKEQDKDKDKDKGQEVALTSSFADKENIKQAFDDYNALAKKIGLPIALKLTKPRKDKIKSRLEDCGGIDGWAVALQKLEESDFCRGSTGWQASLDFLLQQSSLLKLIEGNYENKKGGANGKNGFNIIEATRNIIADEKNHIKPTDNEDRNFQEIAF